jgi:hypothetical protein
MSWLSKLDRTLGEFFQIEDIELRVKMYRMFVVLGLLGMGFLYWNMVDVKSDIEKVLRS